MIEDCYFYLYSECKLNEKCRFRHNPLSKDNLITCKNWARNKSCREDCPLRHSLYHVVKPRSDTLCYWEDKGGCTKYRCEFKHTDAAKDEWKQPKVKLLDEIIENKNVHRNNTTISVGDPIISTNNDVTVSDVVDMPNENNEEVEQKINNDTTSNNNEDKLKENETKNSVELDRSNTYKTNTDKETSADHANDSIDTKKDVVSSRNAVENSKTTIGSSRNAAESGKTTKYKAKDISMKRQEVSENISVIENNDDKRKKLKISIDELDDLDRELDELDDLDKELDELDELLGKKQT